MINQIRRKISKMLAENKLDTACEKVLANMFLVFTDEEDECDKKGNDVSIDCKHENWTISGINEIGFGHCHDCGKEVSLVELFLNLKHRMEKAIEDANNPIK